MRCQLTSHFGLGALATPRETLLTQIQLHRHHRQCQRPHPPEPLDQGHLSRVS